MTELGDILTLQRGFDITKKEQSDGKYPVISSSGINSFHNDYKVEGPGVVIGRKGTLGSAFYCEGDFWPHDTTLWVKDFKGNDPLFIYYLLKKLPLQKLDSGSANPTLNRNYAHRIKVDIPGLNEQKQISQLLRTLDSKITLNNRINQELEAMAKLIYDYWFVQFDFPMSEAQAKAMGKPELAGRPYKASGGPMVYNEQLKREIPKGWEDGTFDDMGEIVGGSTPSKSIDKNFTVRDGTSWITPNDLSNNTGSKYITRGALDVTELGLKDASLRKMPAGTILLTSRAPIGYTAIARLETTSNQGFKSLVPNKGYSTEYTYYTVRLYIRVMKQYASGSTFKEISGRTLKTIKIPIPPKNLVESFTNKVEAIFRKQDILEEENQKLAELRDWLLPMLMNGQVTIREAEEKVEETIN